MDRKTILITGGAGFIGSHLCEYYVNQGHEVVCIDSFFSGKKENINHLLSKSNFRLIRHNIIEPLKIKFDRVDWIFNLACPASPMQYQFDPVLTLRTSIDGVRNMMDLARKYNARFLQASTSEIYGDPLEHPQTESYFGNVDPLGKRSCYDEGKRGAETLCKDYHLLYRLDVRIVRLFNVYGPRMMFNDGRVISNFVLQALLGDDITIHGSGEQSRSFMYIDDLLTALDKVMTLSAEQAAIKPINLGNPDERSIKNLAEMVKDIAHSQSKLVFLDYDKVPERWGDPQRRCPDISRAKKLLAWEPHIDFAEGLAKTVADFQSRLKNKTKIAIFCPTYYPIVGPAEEAIKQITDRMLGYEFHIFTAKMQSGLPSTEKIGNVTVHRLGRGNRFDKYLLPISAVRTAMNLHKTYDFQLAWGVMVSYGALAAAVFAWLNKRAFLASLFEGKIDLNSARRQLFRPFYQFIFRSAHHLQLVADLTSSQQAWLEDDARLQPIDLEMGWDYLAKKTKEEFQQLEILSSRL